ncbi:MAG: class I mannose-6-phosphate isomerase [Chloroflexi bacterium]|nr:class I mannose-6-phosphate isomerase [Chloroflexota bacterium]
MSYRKTPQPLLPKTKPPVQPGAPDIYPGHPVASGEIQLGYESLAAQIAGRPLVLIDGYAGVLWDDLRAGLTAVGIDLRWIATDGCLKPEVEIDSMLADWLGGDDPLFGRRFPGELVDFFDAAALARIKSLVDDSAQPIVIYGTGAFLFGEGWRVYVDLPKNEAQYRSRAGVYRNLGARAGADAKTQYKRMYFVDWVALNRHKAAYVQRIDCFVDGQDPAQPSLIASRHARATFSQLSRSAFRPRPWFEPGAWGGQWLKSNLPGLAQAVPNYAWSFEMIAPEQGIILQHDDKLLELSCDWLQYHDNAAVLGEYAACFGFDFPIRFDFLDTIGGGNLSLQCHPRPGFIRRQFGERFTQDETYYIVAATDGACVYLGFQPGINQAAFRAALEDSQQQGKAVAVERFVKRQPARPGDLFLIPHGVVHCSGAGTLVLEISATPYIFTFKMYDWLRRGLDGLPRPLNLERAFANLDFALQGDAADALVSQPQLLRDDADCRIEQLPTHARHFYDIQRLTLRRKINCETAGSPQLLMIVAGGDIELAAGERKLRCQFAETYVLPAAAGPFALRALDEEPATIIRAYLRAEWFTQDENQWLLRDDSPPR